MENVSVQDIVHATGGVLLSGNSDALLNKIRLDSRQVEAGDLFVPIIGEKVDAHRFLPQVAENGAGAVLTSEQNAKTEEMEKTSCAWIAVDDTKKALQAVGRYLRKRLTLPIVGQVGVPITVSEITKADEVGVLELGMSEPGELTVIAQIAKPDIAVITNIGITHIEQLGSRENIYKEKMTIQDGLSDGGVLVLNGDDDMLQKTKGKDGVKTVYYGTSENCDYRAVDLVLTDGKAEFTALHGRKTQKIRLNVMGMHNVMNAMAAIAVCCERGMTMAEAAEGLLTFHGFKHRQQVYADGRFTVMDDSYNASPASMKAALDVFKGLTGKRHIAVLADMKELGENYLAYHREVGEYVANSGVDLVVTLGEASKCLAEGVRAVKEIPVVEFLDRDEMVKYLEQEVKDGDCILFKGSNSMGLSAVADKFAELAEK